ncbi:MAG: hypothetical protein Q7S33_00890 [Nanoarchaeota archaeon]|nr:hypothetical protein [Nanoarchaeota archaeon]
MIENKKGWIKILEAFLGIMLIMGVLLYAYQKNQQTFDISDYVYESESRILDNIALNDVMRLKVLDPNDALNPGSVAVAETYLTDYAQTILSSNFQVVVRICELTSEAGVPPSCFLTSEQKIDAGEKEVFVQERIISSTYAKYNPRKVKIFVWTKA